MKERLYRPLVRLAAHFTDQYDELASRLLPGLQRAFPKGRPTEHGFVIPIRHRGPKREAIPDEAAEMITFLEAWGARDIDLRSNMLTWWNGQVMRIGRALTQLASRCDSRNWREKEARYRKGTEWEGHELPELPDRATIAKWQDQLCRFVDKSARHGRRRDLVAVVCFDPVEIAHKSTGRGWTSCHDPGRRGDDDFDSPWRYTLHGLCCGRIVVWLTRESDAEALDNPIGRTVFDVFFADDDPRHFCVEIDNQSSYGDLPPWWDRWIHDFEKKIEKTCGNRPGVYRMPYAVPESLRKAEEFEELVRRLDGVGNQRFDRVERIRVVLPRGWTAAQELLERAVIERTDDTGWLRAALRETPVRVLAVHHGRTMSTTRKFILRMATDHRLREGIRAEVQEAGAWWYDYGAASVAALVLVPEEVAREDPLELENTMYDATEWLTTRGCGALARQLRQPYNAEVLDRAVAKALRSGEARFVLGYVKAVRMGLIRVPAHLTAPWVGMGYLSVRGYLRIYGKERLSRPACSKLVLKAIADRLEKERTGPAVLRLMRLLAVVAEHASVTDVVRVLERAMQTRAFAQAFPIPPEASRHRWLLRLLRACREHSTLASAWYELLAARDVFALLEARGRWCRRLGEDCPDVALDRVVTPVSVENALRAKPVSHRHPDGIVSVVETLLRRQDDCDRVVWLVDTMLLGHTEGRDIAKDAARAAPDGMDRYLARTENVEVTGWVAADLYVLVRRYPRAFRRFLAYLAGNGYMELVRGLLEWSQTAEHRGDSWRAFLPPPRAVYDASALYDKWARVEHVHLPEEFPGDARLRLHEIAFRG